MRYNCFPPASPFILGAYPIISTACFMSSVNELVPFREAWSSVTSHAFQKRSTLDMLRDAGREYGTYAEG